MSGGRWMWLAVAAIVASSAAVGASPVRITFDRHAVVTNAPVLSFRGGLLVPLRSVSRTLGGQMRWDEATRTVVVRHRGRRLEVSESAHQIRLDGKPMVGLMSRRTSQGQLLVPIAAVERLFGVHGRWQPKRQVLGFVPAGGGSGPAGPRGAGKAGGPDETNPPAAAGLSLLLTADRMTYASGTPVRLTLAVTNSGRSPVALQFSSGQKYDIVVRRAGQTVWNWAADRMFTQALSRLTMAPGERQTFTETWKQQDNHGQPVPAGDYEAIATLTTMTRPQPQSKPIAFRIGS